MFYKQNNKQNNESKQNYYTHTLVKITKNKMKKK